jgi:hypothetical protein
MAYTFPLSWYILCRQCVHEAISGSLRTNLGKFTNQSRRVYKPISASLLGEFTRRVHQPISASSLGEFTRRVHQPISASSLGEFTRRVYSASSPTNLGEFTNQSRRVHKPISASAQNHAQKEHGCQVCHWYARSDSNTYTSTFTHPSGYSTIGYKKGANSAGGGFKSQIQFSEGTHAYS